MNIIRSTQKSVGSITSLRYVLISDVSSFTTIMRFRPISLDEISLKNNVQWKKIYFTPETCSAESVSKDDDAGIFYTNSIEFEYHGENAETSNILEYLVNVPILVIATNLNGTERLFGTPQNPVKLRYNQKTEKTVMQNTGYDVSISGNGIYPALFIC